MVINIDELIQELIYMDLLHDELIEGLDKLCFYPDRIYFDLNIMGLIVRIMKVGDLADEQGEKFVDTYMYYMHKAKEEFPPSATEKKLREYAKSCYLEILELTKSWGWKNGVVSIEE